MVSRVYVLGFVSLLVCLAVVGGLASEAVRGTPTAADHDIGIGSSTVEDGTANGFDRTTFTLTIYENGSMQWTTTYAKPLNETEIEEFRAFATEFNTTETPLYQDFVSQASVLAARANETTGRTTQVRNFRKVAFVEQGGFTLDTQGKVRMSFLWTNIARVSGDRVVLGDVFEQGLALGSSMRLIVEPGPNLSFDTVDPDPDSLADPTSLSGSDSVTWQGDRQFNDQRPRVALVPDVSMRTTTTAPPAAITTARSSTTLTTVTTTPDTSTTLGVSTTPGASGAGGGDTLVVVAIIVLLLSAGTLAVYRTMVSTGTDDAGAGQPSGTDSPTDDGVTSTAATTPRKATDATPPADPAVSDEELLSDADRVHTILEQNGGRMRQSAIVEETEWSKSKVSMLLSDMEDEDSIKKLRVGRENIISLPGHEPDAAGSPFDDEE